MHRAISSFSGIGRIISPSSSSSLLSSISSSSSLLVQRHSSIIYRGYASIVSKPKKTEDAFSSLLESLEYAKPAGSASNTSNSSPENFSDRYADTNRYINDNNNNNNNNNRYNNDRFSNDRYNTNNRFNSGDRYNNNDRYNNDRYNNDRHNNRYSDNDLYTGGGGRGKSLGEKLREVDWSTEKLSTVEKNLYKEDDEISAMSPSDISSWRSSHGITITQHEGECPAPLMKFEQAGFPPEITNLLTSKYVTPTPIQSQGWPIALSGHDFVGTSQTGSGKTLGFMLPALVHIKEQMRTNRHRWVDGPMAVILAPTRELAQQIVAESRPYLEAMRLNAALLYGGANKIDQVKSLQRGPQLVVATPGRLIDLLEDNCTNLRKTSFVVLDEADRMLDMGFEPQIRSILGQIRPDRQTLMWTATWPKKVRALAEEFIKNPITVQVGSTELRANPDVVQNIVILREHEKQQNIHQLMDSLHKDGPVKTIIFCATKDNADRVCELLQDKGFLQTESIHGGKSQRERTSILNGFRRGLTSTLVATDVAARGLDVSDIHHVVNYDFPREIEDYVHRIGRTGRAGKSGTSHSFFTEESAALSMELIKVMKDAQQIVPDLLHSIVPYRRGGRSSSFGRGGGGGGGRRDSYGGGGGRRDSYSGGGGNRYRGRNDNNGYDNDRYDTQENYNDYNNRDNYNNNGGGTGGRRIRADRD